MAFENNDLKNKGFPCKVDVIASIDYIDISTLFEKVEEPS